jgi:5,10-methylenetetrahydromethanopterin reductase
MAVGTPRFGLWLFPDHAAGVLADVIVAAEAAGLDEVWLGDEGPARDPLVTLAAAAVRTSTIALGVAVTNPYLRHPAATASAFATLAELAGPGRVVVLGMGSGGDLALGPTGAVRDQPVRRMTDAVRIARAVLRGEATEGYEPPPHSTSAPDVRIVIGARSERLNRLASAEADGVFIGGVPLPMMDTTLGWARAVRPIDAAIYPNVALSPEEVEAIRPQLIYALHDGPAETRIAVGVTREEVQEAVAAMAAGDDGPARALIDERRLDHLLVHGADPCQLGRRLAALARRHAATSVGVAYVGGDPMGALDAVAATARAFRHTLA